MDDKKHVAKYACPDDYEVVYTGEGTATCDGACFRKGSAKSLETAISRIVVERLGDGAILVKEELAQMAEELLKRGQASLSVAVRGNLTRARLEFRAPR